VVKLHPSVPADEFRSRFPRLPGNARLLWREDIRQVIRISDLLVTFRSTVGLLAALAGKPLITLDCTGEPDQVPYVSEGIATGVHRYEDLPGAVEAALGHPRRPPPEGGAFENPPGAAARVLEVLAGRSP
jgi:hypothetical protein